MAAPLTSFQLIDGEGKLNEHLFHTFVDSNEVRQSGTSYVVVAIMGPQSSGKSTLLNSLFRTKFDEMKANDGRSQTTRGIWMAKCPDMQPLTMVMDIEGTDGKEKQDNVSFEKQSALFALVVSNILLINMWCNDIGREQGACRPLLKTILENMLKHFSGTKTTLIYVIRDTTKKTPTETLKGNLTNDINQIWNEVPKREGQEANLRTYFDLRFVFLPHYEHCEDQFEKKVADFREEFKNSLSPGGLAGDRGYVVPACSFSFHVKGIWDKVKGNKDIDLPAHNLMVADHRCSEIAKELEASFAKDESWSHLEQDALKSYVPTFVPRWECLLRKYRDMYNVEAQGFDEGKKSEKRKIMEANFYQRAEGAFLSNMRHLEQKILDEFKKKFGSDIEREPFMEVARNCKGYFMSQFDESFQETTRTTGWELPQFYKNLEDGIDGYAKSVRDDRIQAALNAHMDKIEAALEQKVVNLLKHPGIEMWPKIRRLYEQQTHEVGDKLSESLSGYELKDEERKNLLSSLMTRAKDLVRSKATEESRNLDMHSYDILSNLLDTRTKRPNQTKEEIDSAQRSAKEESCKLLAAMTFTQLDDATEKVGRDLCRALLESNDIAIREIYNQEKESNVVITGDLLLSQNRLFMIRLEGLFDAWRKSNSEEELFRNLQEASDKARKEQEDMIIKLQEALESMRTQLTDSTAAAAVDRLQQSQYQVQLLTKELENARSRPRNLWINILFKAMRWFLPTAL